MSVVFLFWGDQAFLEIEKRRRGGYKRSVILLHRVLVKTGWHTVMFGIYEYIAIIT